MIWRVLAGMLGMCMAGGAMAEQTLNRVFDCRTRGGLANVAARLSAGEAVRVAYVGGSITEADGYRPMTTTWLRERFPKAEVQEINAAVSGTGSMFGVFRLGREVLDHQPDLVFIEFAANDSGVPEADVRRAMEGMVRQAWQRDAGIDIVFVYTLMASYVPSLTAGELTPSMRAMEAVAEHYGVPSVFMGGQVIRQLAAGGMVIKAPASEDAANDAAARAVFSRDGTHPLKETGHRLYAETLTHWLAAMLDQAAAATPHELPDTLQPDHLTNARLVPIDQDNCSVLWERLPATHALARQYARTVPVIWHAANPGDALTLRFKGSTIGAADFTGPDSGHLLVSIDGSEPRLVERFNRWSHRFRRRFVVFADHLPPGDHTLTVTVSPAPIDKAAILATGGASIDDPARFVGQGWYVSDLMVAE